MTEETNPATLQNFYYNEQFKKFLIQFMTIFADMNVQVGWTGDKEPRLIKVPVYAASKDRVVAAIKGENTQNKPIRLPTMSAQLASVDVDPSLRKGTNTTRRITHMPTGGLFPDDIKVVEQHMPTPYRLSFNLYLWTSNQDQLYQIMEQILTLFNPQIQIQTSDDSFDWTMLSMVELKNVSMDENFPAGGDRRICQSTLNFSAPVYLSLPANVHNKFIKDIYVRIGAVSTAAKNSHDIIGELDNQGIEYNLNFSLDDVDLE